MYALTIHELDGFTTTLAVVDFHETKAAAEHAAATFIGETIALHPEDAPALADLSDRDLIRTYSKTHPIDLDVFITPTIALQTATT